MANIKWKAWAIDTRDGCGFIGAGWFLAGTNWALKTPTHLRGSQVSLFETRKEAGAALKDVKGAFPLARVVRVSVSVSVLG